MAVALPFAGEFERPERHFAVHPAAAQLDRGIALEPAVLEQPFDVGEAHVARGAVPGPGHGEAAVPHLERVRDEGLGEQMACQAIHRAERVEQGLAGGWGGAGRAEARQPGTVGVLGEGELDTVQLEAGEPGVTGQQRERSTRARAWSIGERAVVELQGAAVQLDRQHPHDGHVADLDGPLGLARQQRLDLGAQPRRREDPPDLRDGVGQQGHEDQDDQGDAESTHGPGR